MFNMKNIEKINVDGVLYPIYSSINSEELKEAEKRAAERMKELQDEISKVDEKRAQLEEKYDWYEGN